MSLLLFALGLALSPVQAVTTSNCPANLKFTLGQIQTDKSAEDILKEYVEFESSEMSEAIHATMGALAKIPSVSRDFSLDSAKGGKCVYADRVSTNEKIELYTTKGSDRFYTQTQLGPRGILLRAYGKIQSLGKNGLIADSTPVRLALAVPRYPYTSYSAGGPLIFVGEARKMEWQVEP